MRLLTVCGTAALWGKHIKGISASMTEVSPARISKNYDKTMPVPSLLADSITEEQIAVLVDTFYARVRQDETLGPIFERVVGDGWEPHLAKIEPSGRR
jgi:hypothetical protein